VNPLEKINDWLGKLPVTHKPGMRGPGWISAAAGVTMMAQGPGTALAEAPWADKDVANVVDVCHNADLGRNVVRWRPIGVVKG
jgi:hypothetical protein